MTYDKKVKQRMDFVDGLPSGLRSIVHEYGLTVFNCMYEIGIKKEKHMRHIINTILRELRTTVDERPCSVQTNRGNMT